MFRLKKSRARRAEIRRNRPDVAPIWRSIKTPQIIASLAIVAAFWAVAVGITTLRDRMVRYRVGQYVGWDVLSRVDFSYEVPERVRELQREASNSASRVYRSNPNSFGGLEELLLDLPKDLNDGRPPPANLDIGTITTLKKWHEESPAEYQKWVRNFIELLVDARNGGKLVVLDAQQREEELRAATYRDTLKAQGFGPSVEFTVIKVSKTFSNKLSPAERADLIGLIDPLAQKSFLSASVASSLAALAADAMAPTHILDPERSRIEQEEAKRLVSLSRARLSYAARDPLNPLIPAGTIIKPDDWRRLAEEQRAYVASLSWQSRLLSHAGLAAIIGFIVIAMAVYAVQYQPRVVRNHFRAIALAALLLAMLLLAQIAGVSSLPLLIFGVAPTLLSAMVLAIAYDQRFAIGIATLQALLVTTALGQGLMFFTTTWVGVLACCFLLDEVRNRQKLIEVGGLAAVAMMVVVAAFGLLALEPARAVIQNTFNAGAAGLGVGFVMLGLLSFAEPAFGITTSMTLLEFADASQPLLRRLQVEAPGTYSHSLQVATLAEAAAEAIGVNSLLCRVGSYYHDIGKMNKAEYFCENQFDGRNRHINLNPNVSLLIITGHVKDGVEMAKEYALPPVIIPFIQQHHGTTLVEYFYHQACNRQNDGTDDEQPVSDMQYRYPGPKPRTREIAIVMIADAVESATRAMSDPTPSRIETLVHELTMKRLLDGQFDDCEMTFREVEIVERALVKTILSIYHGRLAYPSTSAISERPVQQSIRSA